MFRCLQDTQKEIGVHLLFVHRPFPHKKTSRTKDYQTSTNKNKHANITPGSKNKTSAGPQILHPDSFLYALRKKHKKVNFFPNSGPPKQKDREKHVSQDTNSGIDHARRSIRPKISLGDDS
jgi:hypothetical protein